MSGALSAGFSGSGAGGGSGGGDATLDPLNWSNVNGSFAASNETLTISGINTAVTIAIAIAGFGSLACYKNGTYTDISGGSLTVLNGDTVFWLVSGEASGSVTLTNTSDGAAAVDSFSFDVNVPF